MENPTCNLAQQMFYKYKFMYLIIIITLKWVSNIISEGNNKTTSTIPTILHYIAVFVIMLYYDMYFIIL